jgi:hypothetical protein
VRHRTVNRYDRLEWAGAFGDLNTLMPFVIAYVSVMKLDAFGVLFGFGVSMVVRGWVYKTPFPVQPMKAAGAVATTQAAQSAVITPGAVFGAGLVKRVIWLLLGISGMAQKLTRWISRPVAQGVVLGLSMAFMWQGGAPDVRAVVACRHGAAGGRAAGEEPPRAWHLSAADVGHCLDRLAAT